MSIIRFRLNPFLALLLASLLTGFLVRMPMAEISGAVATGFGNTLRGIGIVIGLGIILGELLARSGATEQIARTLIDKFGERHAPLVLTIVGYFVSTSVFMDAVFVILIPIVIRISTLTKTPLVGLVTPLAIGLITTHNMMIPTPGPVAVAENMRTPIGVLMFYGLVVSVPGALMGGWLYGMFLGKRAVYTAPERQEPETDTAVEKPSAGLSFFILLLPLLMIFFGSVLSLAIAEEGGAKTFFAFIGNKNIALLASVLVALPLLGRYVKGSVSDAVSQAMERAGLILLITGAGGAFGYVITESGIGKHLTDVLMSWDISLLVVAFLLSVVLRAAQGSATVALITVSMILGPVAANAGASPVLVALAICAGGSCLSLPNDSGFWVVTRFSGFEIKETFKSWTLGASISGVVCFAIVLLLNLLRDGLPGL